MWGVEWVTIGCDGCRTWIFAFPVEYGRSGETGVESGSFPLRPKRKEVGTGRRSFDRQMSDPPSRVSQIDSTTCVWVDRRTRVTDSLSRRGVSFPDSVRSLPSLYAPETGSGDGNRPLPTVKHPVVPVLHPQIYSLSRCPDFGTFHV